MRERGASSLKHDPRFFKGVTIKYQVNIIVQQTQ